MNQRILGSTGISVSEIAIGSLQLSGPLVLDGEPAGYPDLGKGYAIDLIRRCGEMGINVIDTADHFAAGEGERRVGEAVKGQRDRWILCSKFGVQVDDLEITARGAPSGRRTENGSPTRLRPSLEASLRRLQTDYLDICLCQFLPAPHEMEPLAEALRKAKEDGLVRAVGLSTGDFRSARAMHDCGHLDVVQFSRNLLQPQHAMVDFLRECRCGVMIRGSMADGRLSGKYFTHLPAFVAEDARSVRYDPLHVAEQFGMCKVFHPLLTGGKSMAQLALRYLLDDATTHTIVIGAKTAGDYSQAIKATDLPALTGDEQAQLEEWRGPLQTALVAEPEPLSTW